MSKATHMSASKIHWGKWAKEVRAQTPVVIDVKKPRPACVLSFGGAGFLCTYSLGAAHFLQQEKADMVAKSYILGAGSGCIPAVALACGSPAVSITKIRDEIVDNLFLTWKHKNRIEIMEKKLEELIPENAVNLINGRVALTIGFSNRNQGYMLQPKQHLYYGHHVATWDDRKDLTDCLMAAMECDANHPRKFRDSDNVMRGTFKSLSSELDQYCRHVHIHGYAGSRASRHQKHNFFMGKHGLVANTHSSRYRQALLAFAPKYVGDAKDKLLEAFDEGFNDARRYERWEDDPYHYAKPDRSSSDDFNATMLRATFFGTTKGEKFEL